MTTDEQQIRSLIEAWAKAVRDKNIDGIIANHTDDIVMFDVPPPFASKGLEAYRQTWATFYNWAKDSGVFDMESLNVVAGSDVAFGFAEMKCSGFTESGAAEPLKFRLTIGLVKINGQWLIKHEHHSIPSE